MLNQEKIDVITEFCDKLSELDEVGVYYDRRWDDIRETSRHPNYIRSSDILEMINHYRNEILKLNE